MNVKNWPVLRPVIALLSSRKFLVIVFAALASVGLDLTPEFQALIIALGGVAFVLATAWEDSATKRAGGGNGRT